MNVQPIGKPRQVFQGKVYRVVEQDVRRPDGSTGTYEFVEKKPGVVVIAMDADGSVAIVRERRALRPGEQPKWALPGGEVDAGETPEQAAARELLEEVGCKGKLEFFARRPQAPRTIWDLRCFVAKTCKPAPAEATAAKEKLELKWVPFMEAIHMVLEGAFEHEFAALSLLQYASRENRIEVLEKELDPRLVR